jgi:phosphoglycolate phosphatase-like HAD superfamily hydrolase
MGERLVLWDVDHTLINAGGWSSHLYGLVFAELFGRELRQVAPMAGRTDRAIIVETLTMAGVPDPRQHVAAFISAMARQAPAYGEQVRARGRVLAGVREALAALAEVGAGGVPGAGGAGAGGAGRVRVRQSVLTGNIRPLAEVKLAALGLGAPLDLTIGAYGDMDEVRAELVGVARARASAGADGGSEPGGDFGGEATVLVGDTPLDVAAALATGARAVAVATGSFSEAELAASAAHAVLPDLSDTERVRAAILGGGV